MESDRKGTRWWVAIMLFVVLGSTTIISGIAAIAAGRCAKKSSDENAALRAEAQQWQQRLGQYQAEAQRFVEQKDRQELDLKLFRHVLGYGIQSPAELAIVRQGLGKRPEAKVLEDLEEMKGMIKACAVELPREEVSYRSLLLHAMASLQARDKQLANANEICKKVLGQKAEAENLLEHLTPLLEKLARDTDGQVRLTAEAAAMELRSRGRPTPPSGAPAKSPAGN